MLVGVRGVEEKLQLGKTFALRKARFSDQLPPQLDVVGKARPALIARQIRRHQTERRELPGAQDSLHDARSIDGQRQRTAHPRIFERLDLGVEPQKESAEERVALIKRRLRIAIAIDLPRRQGRRDVQLAGAKGALFRVGAFDRIKIELLELHRGLIPIGLALHNADDLVDLPVLQSERTVAHEVAGPRPAGAAFLRAAKLLDRRQVQRIPRVMAEHAREIGRRADQRQPQRVVVHRQIADLREIFDLTLHKRSGVLDQVLVQIAVLRGDAGAENAAVGFDEVMRRDGITVGPLRRRAEVERVDRTILGNVPAFRQRGLRARVLRVVAGQPLEQRRDDVKILHRRNDMRVEIGWLAEIAQVQNLVAIALRDAGFGFGTAGQAQSAEDNQGAWWKTHELL